MRREGRIHGGMFHGHRPAPSSLASLSIVEELADQLTSSPGLTAAPTTGRRLFTGGALAPQQFVRPPAGANSALEVARQQVNARRTLGQSRGAPEL